MLPRAHLLIPQSKEKSAYEIRSPWARVDSGFSPEHLGFVEIEFSIRCDFLFLSHMELVFFYTFVSFWCALIPSVRSGNIFFLAYKKFFFLFDYQDCFYLSGTCLRT
jgi:hypothetical protein